VLDQRVRHVPEHREPVARRAVELSQSVEMTHFLFLGDAGAAR